MMKQEGIRDWFEKNVEFSDLKTEIVSFSDPENTEWKIDGNGISRKDRRYYDVICVKTSTGLKIWHKPMIRPLLTNEIYAIVVLLKIGEKYLVQAKPETGNGTPGHVILTTTVQSSYENIKSGEVAYADLIKDLDNKLRFKSIPQDAGMLYHKNNHFIFAEIGDKDFNILHGFFLATREEISLLAEDGLVSEHLMQMLGLLWLAKL